MRAKNLLRFAGAFGLALFGVNGLADDGDAAPPPSETIERPESAPGPTPAARPLPPGLRRIAEPGNEDAAARWLERFRETHPEEFARLRRLRETNPPAFREELRRRLQSRRNDDGGGEGGRRMPRLPPRPDRDPDLDRLEAELLELARRFHRERDAAARDELRERLRAKLIETFERREKVWVQRIAALRRDLDEFEARLDQFRRNREEVIDNRLRAILETSPHPPTEPRD